MTAKARRDYIAISTKLFILRRVEFIISDTISHHLANFSLIISILTFLINHAVYLLKKRKKEKEKVDDVTNYHDASGFPLITKNLEETSTSPFINWLRFRHTKCRVIRFSIRHVRPSATPSFRCTKSFLSQEGRGPTDESFELNLRN